MIKGQQYKLISDICLNINKNLSNRKNEIDERLNNNLEVKLKKSSTKEKYIESIKYNVMFYKISIRNIEFLLDKFIKNGDISNKEKLENELKKSALSCKQYINKAIKSKGEIFNKVDLKIFLSYADIEESDLINKLENEYKILSIYNDVLNIFIRNLAHMNKDDISLLDSDDSIKFIKMEIRKTVNSIVKVSTINKNKESNEINNDESKSNIEVSQVQEKESVKEPITKEDIAKEEEVIEEFEEEVCKEKNELEISYLNALNSLENDKLLSKMDKEYKILCVLEEIDYSKAYGFGEEGIKEYIASIVLLDLVDERYKDLIEGGIRLLINGEFGAVNFAEYIKYLAIDELNIGSDIWNEGILVISDNYKEAMNYQLQNKRFKEAKVIDIKEYIYMIENADKTTKFRKDNAIKVHDDSEEKIHNEHNEKEVYREDNAKTIKKSNFKKYRIAIVLSIVVLILGAIAINGIMNNKSKLDNGNNIVNASSIKDPTDPDVIRALDELYIVTDVDKNVTKYEYSQDDNYIIEDYINKKYYAFKIHNLDENGNITSTEPYNYLVNKQTFNVWIYFAGGQLTGYGTIGEQYEYEGSAKYYYTLSPNIKKAMESIVNVKGYDESYKHNYNPDYTSTQLNDEYYIFEEHSLYDNGEIASSGDYLLAVNKKTLELYYYDYAAENYEDRLVKYTDYENYLYGDTVEVEDHENIRIDYANKEVEAREVVDGTYGIYRYNDLLIGYLREYDISNIDSAKVVYELSDELINSIYQDLKENMVEDEFNKLKREQITWVENKMKSEENMAGDELLKYQTLAKMTLNRCEELNNLYNK